MYIRDSQHLSEIDRMLIKFQTIFLSILPATRGPFKARITAHRSSRKVHQVLRFFLHFTREVQLIIAQRQHHKI